jgi:hypothetical protein
MNITLFSEVTTEQALLEIAKESENYQGLYVDMSDAKQRKYVKDKAMAIKDMIKLVNRVRIDLPKAYRTNVEGQASEIITSLEKSNEPFTLLIDDYDAERKLVLDAEKLRKANVEAAINKENDHEYAILLDKSYLADKLAAEKAQAERDEAIRVEASNRATQAAINAQEVTDRAIAQDQANRIADKENYRKVNRAIYSALIDAGIGKDEAFIVTNALIDKEIPHITINY